MKYFPKTVTPYCFYKILIQIFPLILGQLLFLNKSFGSSNYLKVYCVMNKIKLGDEIISKLDMYDNVTCKNYSTHGPSS